MNDTHSLAQALIKVTGLTLTNAEKFHVSHVNVSKSENFNDNAKHIGDQIGDESVVIKVVLEKRTILDIE